MPSSPFPVLLSGLFCGILIASLILSGKIATAGGLTFPASILLFPATFLIADVLTEVYGYGVARRVIWAGLLTELIWVATYLAAASLPSAPVWTGQAAFVATLGPTPRIAIGGMAAYVVGELLNAHLLAALKSRTGRGLPLRVILSTLVGTGADTIIVVTVAFGGVYPIGVLAGMITTVWGLKVAWEVAALPISLPLIRWLERREQACHLDRRADLSSSRPRAP